MNSSLVQVTPYGKVVINRSDLPLPAPDEEVRNAFLQAKSWGLLAENLDTLAIYTQLRPFIQQGPQ